MEDSEFSASKRLRNLLSQPEILVVPGAGSPLELRLIEKVGFDAAYVSGYSTAAERFGLPDIGLIAYGEIADMLRAGRQVTSIPLIIDCDTGYGDVASVRRAVRGMEALGAAAIQLEDQTWPKRCGHMDGKLVEPEDVALRKIEAAVAARQTDLVIIARTDARQPLGLEAAIRRCHLFQEAGADVLFVDGPESVDELKQVAAAVEGPLLANMSESGKTPILPAGDLQAMGFKIALFPSSAVRLSMRVVSDFLLDLRAKGDSRAWIGRMATLSEANEALGLSEIRAFEANILARRPHD